MPARFNDIVEAFEFVSAGGSTGEHAAFVSRESGKVYWQTDFMDDETLDELPEDIDDGQKYVQIPDKKDLDLGKPLVFDFTSKFLPEDFEEVERIFSRRGAYARFKALLDQRGVLDQWYAFEANAEEAALREWCELNSIELDD